jgi:hypothetical protein
MDQPGLTRPLTVSYQMIPESTIRVLPRTSGLAQIGNARSKDRSLWCNLRRTYA